MENVEKRGYEALPFTETHASPRKRGLFLSHCRFGLLCWAAAIFASIALGTLTFRLFLNAVLLDGCSKKLQGASWGIYLDGRDAIGGRCAYGCAYAEDMEKNIELVYQMLENEASPESGLTMQHVLKVKSIIGQQWREFNNPVSNGVQYCHTHILEPQQISAIMTNITAMDDRYEPRKPVNYTMVISDLLQTYNQDVEKASTSYDLLANLAWLLRNLAFLHPLRGHNGRSRLLLLQFELRRLKIACGTMMFNNNKNIYFESPDSFIARIKEGIDIYEESRIRKFSSNPWRDSKTLDHHFSVFALPSNAESLEACWRKFCAAQPNKKLAAVERAQLGLGAQERQLDSVYVPHIYKHPSKHCQGTSPF